MKKKLRDPADISNDISEGINVTKAEVLTVLMWERQLHKEAVDRLNKLKGTILSAALLDI